MQDFSQTAYLVAMLRALASERPDALFQDPFARRLANGQGAIMVELLQKKAPCIDAIAIRTRVIDDFIQNVVRSHAVDTILNLAAGLDTRPYRLALPSALQWIEVDLPELLTYKETLLKDEHPHCSLQTIKLDLSDTAQSHSFFKEVNARSNQVLVLSEGFLGYLRASQVAALANALYHQPKFHWWLFELASPDALQNCQKQYEQQLLDEYLMFETHSLQFAPSEGVDFFLTYGWKPAQRQSMAEAYRRFNRRPWFAEFLHVCLGSISKTYVKKVAQGSHIVLMERSCELECGLLEV